RMPPSLSPPRGLTSSVRRAGRSPPPRSQAAARPRLVDARRAATRDRRPATPALRAGSRLVRCPAMRNRGSHPLAAAALLTLAAAGRADAGGFYVPEIGARAAGLGAAVVADVGDPSAVFHNP